jgi:hypothetical protein
MKSENTPSTKYIRTGELDLLSSYHRLSCETPGERRRKQVSHEPAFSPAPCSASWTFPDVPSRETNSGIEESKTMSQFWKPTYNGRWTPAELDALAIQGDPIDGMGYGYKCRPDEDALESEHYTVRTINTQGMGNHGSVILVGKTPHGRRMVRQGKIKRLVREGCPERIARVACCAGYGMEAAVWKLAADLVPMLERGVELSVNGHREFQQVTGITDYGCSMPRVWAAIEIARRVCMPNRKDLLKR